jgi:hypothetical protein
MTKERDPAKPISALKVSNNSLSCQTHLYPSDSTQDLRRLKRHHLLINFVGMKEQGHQGFLQRMFHDSCKLGLDRNSAAFADEYIRIAYRVFNNPWA